MIKKVAVTMSLVIIATSVFLGGCAEKDSKSASSEEKTIKLKLGYTQNDKDPLTLGLYELSKNVKARTNGKFIIDVFHSSQLGDTPDVVEQAKSGSNVGCLTDAGRFAGSVPLMGILDAPYLYDNYEEGKKIVTSDLWAKITEDVSKKDGIKILSFNWYQGARHIVSNKLVKTPEDLTGMRVRTAGNPVWQATIEAMGAKPVTMASAEVYAGLQQKVIDGADSHHLGTYGARLYESAKHVSKTTQFHLMTGLIVGEKWFNSLPEEYQKIFAEEAVKAGDFASNIVLKSANDIEEKMKAEGVTITEVDLTPFKKATEKVYDKIPGFTDLRKEINQLLGK